METTTSTRFSITALLPEHYAAVQEIYTLGIATENATFELQAPEWEQWDANHLPNCRLVALHEERVAGWAALTPVSGRCVYRGVAEVSVYIHPDYKGRGLGKQLLQQLVKGSEEVGIWTLQAGIFPENTASVKLHEQCGFRLIGIRERVGQLNGRWRDVCLLERRSKTIGI